MPREDYDVLPNAPVPSGILRSQLPSHSSERARPCFAFNDTTKIPIGYLGRAKAEMVVYLAGPVARGNQGVAAAAQCYIDCYDDTGVAKSSFSPLSGAAVGDCEGDFRGQARRPIDVSQG